MSFWSRDLLGVKTISEVSSSAAITSNTLTIDLSQGTLFYTNLNATVSTFTITNYQAYNASSFSLVFTADGTQRAVSWGTAVTWSGGTPPTLTSTNGKKDIFSFITLNSGSNWYGFIGGQNF